MSGYRRDPGPTPPPRTLADRTVATKRGSNTMWYVIGAIAVVALVLWFVFGGSAVDDDAAIQTAPSATESTAPPESAPTAAPDTVTPPAVMDPAPGTAIPDTVTDPRAGTSTPDATAPDALPSPAD